MDGEKRKWKCGLSIAEENQGMLVKKKKINYPRGAWVAQLVKHLPSAQVMILGS